MTIPFNIQDGTGTDLSASVKEKSGINGLVVYNQELQEFEVLFSAAFNETFGIEMAQDFSFGGTPDGIHNGTDSVLYTAAAISGTKFTFDSTDQANSGTKSIKSNKAQVGNIMEFDRGSDVDLSNFVAITLFVYVDNGWSPASADSVTIYGWDTGTASQIGDAVVLEGFFNETTFGFWQKITIPLEDMTLSSATVDAFRVEIVARSGGGALFYIDDMQVEETGAAAIFKVQAPIGLFYIIQSISFSFVDALNTTLASNSMNNLSYDKILAEPALSTGIVFQRIKDGEVLFSASVKTIGDSIKGGATLKNEISDGTNTCITLETDFGQALTLDPRTDDSISIILSDDLSGFISFTAIFKGKTRPI